MKYRREIDGLRAVAVLPVILFHAGFKSFEGGFIGVDVFFVISGYLITTIILSDLDKGNFSIVTFYERRTRRILPALFFVMLCCLPFAWLWLSPSHLTDFSQSLAAVSLFSSNVLFWQESGYFATAAELKPLLHTWSLAVEEQYYVLFPLFLMALWKLRKRWIFGTLMLVAFFSLAGAQYGAYSFPSATFFLLPTRGWELAIGALIAFYFLYKKEQESFIRSHKAISELFGYLGFGLILYSIFAFDKMTPFPSFFALIPTIGTALIIIFTTQETSIGRFLGTRIMVGIGLISYSAYLWHQPLFVFARHRISTEPSTELLLALSALSIVLAFISWRYVEIPFRHKGTFSRKKIFTFAVLGSVFYASIGLAGYMEKGFPNRLEFPERLVSSFEKYEPKCSGVNADNFCDVGEENIEPSFVVFGDSHAASLYGAFDSVAKSEGKAGRLVAAHGCPPLLGVHVLRNDINDDACIAVNESVLNFVSENEVDTLFLVARWNSYTDAGYAGRILPYLGLSRNDMVSLAGSRRAFLSGFRRTMQEYQKLGVSVVLFTQIPWQKYQVDSIYKEAYKEFSDFERLSLIKNGSVQYKEHLWLNSYVNRVFASHEYPKVINCDDIFCDDEICYAGTLEESYYWDDDHLSIIGANKIIPRLHEVFRSNL